MQFERALVSRGVTGSLFIAAALLAVTLAATGCGGVECADGTVEQDGECVLADDYRCGDGEVLRGDECIPGIECGPNAEEQDGQCVAEEPASCGPAMELDPNENECFATDEACGANTAFSSELERCVPTDEVCQDGTYFDEDTSLCYPDAQCQPGDVISEDGECVSVAQNLADQADVEADGNTDPTLEGQPVQVQLDDPGDDVVFKGTIDEPGDDEDQAWDYFEFQAEEGEWFEVTLHSLGLPDPMFEVRAEDGSFQRFSAEGTGNAKDRQVAIPHDGTYYVVVKTSGDPDDVIAGEDWHYAGTIEQINTEDPEGHDPALSGPISGTLGDLGDNFFTIDAFEDGERVMLEWNSTPPQVETAIQQWSGDDEYLSEISGDGSIVEVPESGELNLLIDWVSGLALRNADYQLAMYAPVLDLGPDDTVDIDFTAGTGDMARFEYTHTHSWDYDSNITVVNEDGDVVFEANFERGEVLYYQIEEGGDFTVTFDNDAWSTTYPNFVPMVDVIRRTQAAALSVNQGDLVTVTQNNADDNDVIFELTDDDGNVLEHTDVGVDAPLAYFIEDDDLTDVDVWFLDVEQSSNLTINADVHTPEAGPDFTADIGDFVLVEQDNPLDERAYVIVEHDDDEEVVFSDWIRIDQTVELFIDELDGSYSTSYVDITGQDSVTVSVDVLQPEEETTFTADPWDLIVLEQTNDDDGEVILQVTNDDEGETVYAGSVAAGQPVDVLLGEHGGNYSIAYQNLSQVTGLDITFTETAADEVHTFNADAGTEVDLEQTNADEDDVLLAVVGDDHQEAYIFGLFSDGSSYDFHAVYGGDQTVYHYDIDGVSGLDVTTDVGDAPTALDTITVPDHGKPVIVELNHDSSDDIDIVLINDDEDIMVDREEFDDDLDHGAAFVGAIAGEHTIATYDDNAPTPTFTVDIVEPTTAVMGNSYTGTTSDNWWGGASYYLLDMPYSMDVEMTLEFLGSDSGTSGTLNTFHYRFPGQFLESRAFDSNARNFSPVQTQTFRFEYGRPYIVRVGYDWNFLNRGVDYGLTFD